MTQNGLKHILNRSLKIMEFDHNFFLVKTSLKECKMIFFLQILDFWGLF